MNVSIENFAQAKNWIILILGAATEYSYLRDRGTGFANERFTWHLQKSRSLQRADLRVYASRRYRSRLPRKISPHRRQIACYII